MEYKSLFLLGRQPAIGRAELESLFGASALTPVGEHAMGCNVPVDHIDFARLGGSIRLAKPLKTIAGTNWQVIPRELTAVLKDQLDILPPEGKIKLGLSAVDVPVKTKQLFAAGLELKKTCKQRGRSVRLVPNTELELNTAQVLHNQLTGPLGIELLLIKAGSQTVIAQTVSIQDIDAYARRDQGRPKRDARVGMLPPKLAQVIVNLAAGAAEPAAETVVLDPFCGTGVVLQEALLMGFGAYGTDLEPRMIEFSAQNLAWLATQGAHQTDPLLEPGDATNHQWQPFSVVASEVYLGRPLSNWPNPGTLHDIIGTCNAITEKFLRNLQPQAEPGTRLCLAVPCWRSPEGRLHHLPLLDHLDEIGYNRIEFEHIGAKELVYYRPDQIVARELLVITRK